MAAPMIPPDSAPAFLAEHGWGGAEILPLAGDASPRRYFRIRSGGKSAVLMDAPPPEELDPFLDIAAHLLDRGFSPPRPLAVDRAKGLLLLEDFGDDRVTPLLQREPERELEVYEQAVDILARLTGDPAPIGLPPYDDEAMAREVALFSDWYAPALGMEVDQQSYLPAWRQAWTGLVETVAKNPVLVLRDYHADNLMVRPGAELGLLDFQDALGGHRAYDLVSLLQDARRDVAPELEEAMIARFAEAAGIEDKGAFRADYEILGAQRNTKILGIFTRLWRRDGKAHYLQFQPRVWAYMERNLAHPALEPVRAWFDSNVPEAKRAAAWREVEAI
jgi:aminoglycoside/choline kinase family phosphotransferase